MLSDKRRLDGQKYVKGAVYFRQAKQSRFKIFFIAIQIQIVKLY